MTSARVSYSAVLHSATALLLAMLILCAYCSRQGEAAPAPLPFFGLGLNSLPGFDTVAGNSTSLLGLLALQHLQHKIDTFSALADLFALSENVNSTTTTTTVVTNLP